MGCPVHIWVPMMASMAPFTRVARDRLSALRAGRGVEVPAPPVERKRWAPVQPHPPGVAEAPAD